MDVTLSCEGETLQGHKVILSACSPYFKKILTDNPCRHPVLILNDIKLEVCTPRMDSLTEKTQLYCAGSECDDIVYLCTTGRSRFRTTNCRPSSRRPRR